MNIVLLFFICIIFILGISITFFVIINQKIKSMKKILSHQYSLMIKIQSVLKSKYATNIVAENAEMIYQDLLQNLIPIMASIDIMPRNTSEHPLWRALGGIIDEYGKNPFVLEKLRCQIKLNSEITKSIDNYLNRADKFLGHITTTESQGILASSFTDGLLGQSITLFSQAKQLANQD